MKKLLVAIAVVGSVASAMPAAAQYSPYSTYGVGVLAPQLNELRFQIDESARRGRIARDDAYSLRDELAHLERLEQQYRRGGLSSWERGDLQRRLVLLRDRVRYVETMGQRGYEPGYDDSRGWDDRASDRDWTPIEPRVDGRGWQGPGQSQDDSTWQDDEWTGTYPQGGWNADDQLERGGVGRGVDPDGEGWDEDWYEDDRRTDNRAVSGLGSRQLRVGDRAPVNLSPLPPEYRSRYRDGGGVYYRYDDGRVFQIEQRTGTIRWIGALPY